MPRAILCLDCGKVTKPTPKGRCSDCQRAKDQADPYQQRAWRKTAKEAKRRGGNACAVCGSTELVIAHHRQARKEGGADSPDNSVLLCGAGAIGMPWRSCHSQYEADRREHKNTKLRSLVEAL